MNANAGRVRRRYLAGNRFWEGLLPDHAVRITEFVSDLPEAVAALASQNVRVVASLGGDGTIHRTINAMIRQYGKAQMPMVLPLAGGTLNGVAHALGTRRAAEIALRGALDAIDRDCAEIRTQSLLRVHNATSSQQHVGFTFASGLAARAVEHYTSRTNRGLPGAAATSLLPVTSAVFGGTFYDPVALNLTVDDEPWSAETHTFVAGVLANPVLWFRPFGDASRREGRIFAVAATMRPSQIAPRLWKIFRGRCNHPGLRMHQAADAHLRLSESFVIDGEVFPEHRDSEIRISTGPAIRFLR